MDKLTSSMGRSQANHPCRRRFSEVFKREAVRLIVEVKQAWITQHGDSFPVSVMCDMLNISPSGYYDSITRPPSNRARRYERIQQVVGRVHAESHGIYGSHKAWSKVAMFIVAQILGAACVAFLVWLHYRDHFAATKDSSTTVAGIQGRVLQTWSQCVIATFRSKYGYISCSLWICVVFGFG
jgi:hypothetical protein